MHKKAQDGIVNFSELIAAYDQAIGLGSVSAMNNRAAMHVNGQGGPVDMTKAARLYRRASENNDAFALSALNDPSKVVFHYHYAMSQGDVEKVVELMRTHWDLVAEFIEFDCDQDWINSSPKNLEHIKHFTGVFIEQCRLINLDELDQNALTHLVLVADSCDGVLGRLTGELIQLKKYCLSKLNLADLPEENILNIMQLVINTWYSVTNDAWSEEAADFTKMAAQILSQAMYRIRLLDEEKSHDFLKNIALILVKNLYGEHYGVRMVPLSVVQIMLLIAFNRGQAKYPVSVVNGFLGGQEFIYKYKQAQADVTATDEQSLLASGSAPCFFHNQDAHDFYDAKASSDFNTASVSHAHPARLQDADAKDHHENVQAIAMYERGIERGCSRSMFYRAVMHEKGESGAVNFTEAIRLYNQAIALGNRSAMVNRALMHQEGRGGAVNFAEAIRLHEQGIALGSMPAMYIRADMHIRGQGGAVNFAEAIRLFEQLIPLGCSDAMYIRAYMHEEGKGGAVNLVEAIQLYEQAIALNHPLALYNRGRMHEEGRGGAVNFAEAIRLYDQAILLGDANAMVSRALMYKWGQGGDVNFSEAIRLYDQAITLGDIVGMYNRAFMHVNGQGGSVDMTKAARLYRRAVEGHDVQARNVLNNPSRGVFYYHYAMSQGDFEQVVELMRIHWDLVTEFTEFDCDQDWIHSRPQHLERIKNFTSSLVAQCRLSNLDELDQNALYHVVFIADSCDRALGVVAGELIQLKKHALLKLNLANLPEEKLLNIMRLVIDTWYRVTKGGWGEEVADFTKAAAQVLSQAMYRMMLLDQEKSHDFLKNIALILVKNLYGEQYGVRMMPLSVVQIMLLIAFNSGQAKYSASVVNRFLGAPGLIYEYTQAQPPVELTVTAQQRSLVSGSAGYFFKAEEVSANTDLKTEFSSKLP